MRSEIERAKSGRSKCRACGDAIANGQLRLAEEAPSESVHFSGTINRYYHLECAVRDRPRELAQALQVSAVEIPDREELESQVKGAIGIETQSEATEAEVDTADEYRKFAASVATASAEDFAEAALVFADWLQSVADPRGDFIALHHAMESAPEDERRELEERAKTLLARNSKTLVPKYPDVEFSWRSGFVWTLLIHSPAALVRERMEELFQHPSMLAVRAIAVRCHSWQSFSVVANLPLPATVTSLEIDIGQMDIGPLDDLAHSSLTHLSLTGSCDVSRLELPSLETLELRIDGLTASQLRALDRGRLPALTSLAVHSGKGIDALVDALVASSVFAGLSSLTLSGGLTVKGAAALISSGVRLERLDIADNPKLPLEVRGQLDDVASEVVDGGSESDEPEAEEIADVWRVRHVRKPEWGVGVVIEEFEDRIEIEFENAGRKVIRGLELIEDA